MRKSLHTTTHHAISKPSTSHKSSTSVIGSIPLFPLLPLSNDRYRLSDIASLPSTTKTPLTTSTASTSSSEFPGPKSVPTLLAENKSLQAEMSDSSPNLPSATRATPTTAPRQNDSVPKSLDLKSTPASTFTHLPRASPPLCLVPTLTSTAP